METTNIFPENPEFLALLLALNQEQEQECVTAFRTLTEGMVDPKKPSVTPSKHQEVLNSILETVAFYPLKPSVMQVRRCPIWERLLCQSRRQVDQGVILCFVRRSWNVWVCSLPWLLYWLLSGAPWRGK